MAFPPQFLQQIRDQLPVSRVVARKVRLTRRGREFVGLSPFQSERTPSFTVNDDKQFYHCFSSGRHGDVFRFIMETEGLSFPEAVTQLAESAGLTLPPSEYGAAERADSHKPLYALLQAAAVWFRQQLASDEGKAARALLAARQVSDAAAETFELGYAPRARDALLAHLRTHKASDAQLEAVGLAARYEGREGLQARFADRLVFPIRDRQARVIGFGGRALSADAKAKYLNSPETLLFHKRETLYNLHRARPQAFAKKALVLVEGYMDVIALAEAGLQHAVAPLGTAISEQQIQLAWRLAAEPIVCLDGDAAGRQAAARLVQRALPLLQPGQSLRFVLLPEGQDPDDLVRREGLAALQALMQTARPLVEMLWEQTLADTPHETPEGQALLRVRVREQVAMIRDEDVRALYAQALQEKMLDFFPLAPYTDAPERRAPALLTRPGFARSDGGRSAAGSAVGPVRMSPLARGKTAHAQGFWPHEAALVAAMLRHPSLLLDERETLAHCRLRHTELAEMRDEMIAHADAADAADSPAETDRAAVIAALEAHLHAKGFAPQLARLARHPGQGRWPCLTMQSAPEAARANWLEIVREHHHLSELETERQTAESELEQKPEDEAAQKRLVAIKAELGKVERRDSWYAPDEDAETADETQDMSAS